MLAYPPGVGEEVHKSLIDSCQRLHRLIAIHNKLALNLTMYIVPVHIVLIGVRLGN